jgi:hypothetical protein
MSNMVSRILERVKNDVPRDRAKRYFTPIREIQLNTLRGKSVILQICQSDHYPFPQYSTQFVYYAQDGKCLPARFLALVDGQKIAKVVPYDNTLEIAGALLVEAQRVILEMASEDSERYILATGGGEERERVTNKNYRGPVKPNNPNPNYTGLGKTAKKRLKQEQARGGLSKDHSL